MACAPAAASNPLKMIHDKARLALQVAKCVLAIHRVEISHVYTDNTHSIANILDAIQHGNRFHSRSDKARALKHTSVYVKIRFEPSYTEIECMCTYRHTAICIDPVHR